MKPTKEDILQALYMLKPTLRQKGVAKIALFGSFATATQTPYSDI
jgi:predicted nucleotidyltransferase